MTCSKCNGSDLCIECVEALLTGAARRPEKQAPTMCCAVCRKGFTYDMNTLLRWKTCDLCMRIACCECIEPVEYKEFGGQKRDLCRDCRAERTLLGEKEK